MEEYLILYGTEVVEDEGVGIEGNRDEGNRRGGNTRGRVFHQHRNQRLPDDDRSLFIMELLGQESVYQTVKIAMQTYLITFASYQYTRGRGRRGSGNRGGNRDEGNSRGRNSRGKEFRQNRNQRPQDGDDSSFQRPYMPGISLSSEDSDIDEHRVREYARSSSVRDRTSRYARDTCAGSRGNTNAAAQRGQRGNSACKYTGLRQQVLHILTTLEASEFLKVTLLKFIVKLKSLSEISLEEYEASMLYILNICKEIKSRIPSSMFQVVGITTLLGQIVSKLSDSERPSSQELILAYKHLDDSNEEEMEQITSDNNKSYRQFNFESNQQPPQDFHEIPVFPEMHDIHVDIYPFLRKNKIFGGYENLQHYLDVQFRLLREDFIGPLRDGIQDYIAALKRPKEKEIVQGR
ncbi:unnamed protein product [Mytilus edulis]|uniref:Uncharacterized protein n=1 Tax=Mytilus edulis TaxID=6550 RepID=A0A8S3U0T3_MYTED|nr:unnamed protein product [Mytilus edulis]